MTDSSQVVNNLWKMRQIVFQDRWFTQEVKDQNTKKKKMTKGPAKSEKTIETGQNECRLLTIPTIHKYSYDRKPPGQPLS